MTIGDPTTPERQRFWLGAPGGDVASTWFWPPPSRLVRTAVVIVPGIAHEERTMATGLAAIAEALAEQGMASLLIDLGGTAQSGGTLEDPGVVDRWPGDVAAAVTHARASGFDRVVVIAVRTGALAATGALRDTTIDGLVLWGPVTSGRRYSRELRLLAGVSNRSIVDGSGVDLGVEIAGFTIPASVVDGLRRMDVSALNGLVAARVLVVDSPERRHTEAIAAFEQAGAVVDEMSSSSTQPWLYETMDGSDIPSEDIRRVVEWVTTHAGSRSGPFVPLSQPMPFQREIEHRGTRIRETWVGLGPGDLTAVWCEPAHPMSQHAAPVRVLTSAVGPGRAFVEFARDEAALGYTSLRFDFSGFGTSPRHPGQTWNGYYSAEGSDDVRAALDYVHARADRQVVVIGFCASAWSTLQAGPRPDIAALVALNVHLYVRDSRGSILNNPGSNAVHRLLDRRLSRNRRPKLHHLVHRVLPLPAVPIRWADAFLNRHIHLLLCFDDHDDGWRYLQRHMPKAWPAWEASNTLAVRAYESLGHSLEGPTGRAKLMEDLHRELARFDAGSSSPPGA